MTDQNEPQQYRRKQPDTVHVSTGGAVYEIRVGTRTYCFQIPGGCGICEMNNDGSGRKTPWPKAVWDAVDLWEKQGRRMNGNRCLWGTL